MKLLPKLAALGCALAATTALAADHRDGAGVKADPPADINDVFAFTSGNNVELMMTVLPFADKATAKFSDQVLYSWHVQAYNKFLGGTPTAGEATDVICSFAVNQTIECWVGTKDYVKGDASAEAGLKSADAKLKVFAGPRADPFYFYLTGFNKARTDVISVLPAYVAAGVGNNPGQINPNGCPNLLPAHKNLVLADLVATMQSQNDFATANTLGISVEVDMSLLAKANEVIAVWASTNKKM